MSAIPATASHRTGAKSTNGGAPTSVLGKRLPFPHPQLPETVMLPATPLSAVAHERPRNGLHGGAVEGMVRHDVEVTDQYSSARQHPQRSRLATRHRLLQWVLLVHVPVLAA